MVMDALSVHPINFKTQIMRINANYQHARKDNMSPPRVFVTCAQTISCSTKQMGSLVTMQSVQKDRR